MANDPEDDRLLHEVLGETVPAQFREQLLRNTLRHARQRRRRRRMVPVAGVALGIVLLAMTLRWLPSLRHSPEVDTNGLVVSTHPFNPGGIVRTQSFHATVRTDESAPCELVRTSDGRRLYRIVGDNELLALAAPRQAVLVRVGPHAQELVFANGRPR